MVGDPVAFFTDEEPAPKPRARKLAINIGPSKGHVFGRDEGRIRDVVAGLIKVLARAGWDISLFPVVDDDISHLREAERLADIGELYLHEEFLDLGATLGFLRRQDVFLGEKLHSVVLASCVATPSVMLEYRTKCRDFMRSINREEWTYRTDKLDVDQLVDAVTRLYDDCDNHQRQIHSQMMALKSSLVEAAETVMQLVGAG
jgi:polysaccharide pyruvyl transferase WcaK-like protein